MLGETFYFWGKHKPVMSATELKEILHKQIDSLQNVEDVQDLLLTVNEFVGQRQLPRPESPEMLAQLQEALRLAQMGHVTPHEEVNRQAKAWLIK
jgi:hypothetical protein